MQNLLLKTFKAVSDPHRMLILAGLRQKPMFVCELAKITGLAYSTTSQHLHILRQAGLISDEKQGRWVRYRIEQNPQNPYCCQIMDLITHWSESNPAIQDSLKKASDQTTNICSV